MRAVVLSLVLVAGCSLDRAPLQGMADANGTIDSGGLDAGPARDAGPDGGLRDDAGPPDAGIDATMPSDSGIDSGIDAGIDSGIDAGRDSGIDSGIDSGTDAGRDSGVDSGIDAGPPPLRGCDDIYGGLSGYVLCAERATECEFFTSLGGSSCGSRCASVGGTCSSTYSESGGPSGVCTRSGGARACGDTHSDEICICSRIP